MKRVIGILLSIVLIFGIFYQSPNASASSNDILSSDEAIEVAEAFINSDMQVNDDSFDEGIELSDTKELYGLDDEISAYLLEFVDEQGEDSGYVVVGATQDNAAIIEYAYEGTCFLDKVEDIVGDEYNADANSIKFYYNGGLDYFVENQDKDEFFYIGNNLKEVDKSKVEKNKNSSNSYKKEWDNINNTIKRNSGEGSSTPSGKIILSPSSYESGYTSYDSEVVTGSTGYTYFTMDDFDDSNTNCGPTCALNFLYYWYKQGKTDFLQDSWTDVYDILYDGMYDASDNTTYVDDMISTMKSYLKKYGDGYSSATYYYPASWSKVSTEINADYPAIILLQSHKYYGDHYVLGVGYREYTYSSSYSRYILIVDGYGTKATRYVHFTTGYYSDGGVCVVKIRPK